MLGKLLISTAVALVLLVALAWLHKNVGVVQYPISLISWGLTRAGDVPYVGPIIGAPGKLIDSTLIHFIRSGFRP